MSNGNAAAALMVTVAMLTGVAHVQGSPAGRQATPRRWSHPERQDRADRPDRTARTDRTDQVELGDTRIPVRTVRRSYAARERPRDLYQRTPKESPEVIVGYVNPARGTSAFHRLTNVVEGDRVKVVRHDHRVDWYKVDSIRRALRRDLAEERSSSTGRPELRLISWRGTRSPRDVVVSAHLDRQGPADD